MSYQKAVARVLLSCTERCIDGILPGVFASATQSRNAGRLLIAILFFALAADAGQPQINTMERHVPNSPVASPGDIFSVSADFRNPDSMKNLKELLAKGADPNQVNQAGELLLNHAIRNSGHSSTNPPSDIRESRYDNVLLIIESGADVRKNGSGGTPLHVAAKQGDVNLVYLLLEKGADINARDSQGNTPLHSSLPFGFEAFNILLHKGADRDSLNDTRQSISDLILYFRNPKFLRTLLRHGADPKPIISGIRDDMSRYPGRDKERMLAEAEAFVKAGSKKTPPPPAPKQRIPSEQDPPIVAATRANRPGEVKKLLEIGADPDSIGAGFHQGVHDFKAAITHGSTSLHIALFSGFDEISRLLVEKGADVNLRASPNDFDDNVVPLMLAAKSASLTRLLLDHGAKVDITSARFANTALMTASRADVMKLLLEHGANINHQAIYGNVLKDAVDKKDLAKVDFLLKNGAKINLVCEHDGSTPLHAAVSAGEPAIVRLLLDKGADPAIKNYQGFNPYEQALSEKKAVIAELFRKGEEPKSDPGLLIADAVQRGNHELLKKLLDDGADPDGDPKWPYLIRAMYSGREPDKTVIRLLVGHGASVKVTDTNKRSLLHFIRDPELIALLVSKGANVKAADNQGETPLHKAAENGDTETVKQLIKSGADAVVRENDGRTPLHFAARGPRDERPADGPPPDWAKIPDFLETIRILSKAGCSSKDPDKHEKTPIDTAGERREPEMKPIRELLESLP